MEHVWPLINCFDCATFQLQLRTSDINHRNIQIRQQHKQIKDLTNNNDTLRKACKEMGEVSESVVKNKIRSAFRKIFTENQIDLILGTKTKVVWTPDEIAMAFSLR